PLLARRAPVGVSVLQPVLVAEQLAATEGEPEEIYLQLVLIGREIREQHVPFPERRDELRYASHAEAADQDGRRGRRRVERGKEGGRGGERRGVRRNESPAARSRKTPRKTPGASPSAMLKCLTRPVAGSSRSSPRPSLT